MTGLVPTLLAWARRRRDAGAVHAVHCVKLVPCSSIYDAWCQPCMPGRGADVMLAPYMLLLQRLGAKLDSLPNVSKYVAMVKVRS